MKINIKTNMKRNLLSLAVVSSVAVTPAMAEDLINISLGSGGLKVTKGDSKFQMGGRAQFDFVKFDEEDDLDNFSDGTDVRRARLYVKGNVGSDWKYKVQYDFADSDMKDLYIKYTGSEAGDILIGQAAPAMFLDSYTSSKWTTFIERAVVDNFAAARELGLGFQRAGDNYSFYTSVTGDNMNNDDIAGKDEDGDVIPADDTATYAARLTLSPVHETGNAVHLGFTAAYEDLNGYYYAAGARPGSKVDGGNKLVKSYVDSADARSTYGVELAFMSGPLSTQAEHVVVEVDANGTDDEKYTATYGQVSYFLTGESRSYYVDGGIFDAPTSMKNSWEVAARYEEMDLSDSTASRSGEMETSTLGLNFYPNKNIRFAMNLINSKATLNNNTEEEVKLVQLRSQLVF
ncbi:MAG: porin [Bermanella sp.]